MSIERNKYISYIDSNINELKISHRTEVLQTILNSNISDDKIVEKGNGTQIKFSDMEISLLKYIYNLINKNLESSADII